MKPWWEDRIQVRNLLSSLRNDSNWWGGFWIGMGVWFGCKEIADAIVKASS